MRAPPSKAGRYIAGRDLGDAERAVLPVFLRPGPQFGRGRRGKASSMGKQPRKAYGVFTAAAMVVGIVIGSGVFFKAEAVLTATGGDLVLGVLAWAAAGCVMLSCAAAFSVLAGRRPDAGGPADYARDAAGPGYAYCVGWFLAAVYYPSMTAVLAWASARYTCLLLGADAAGGGAMLLAALFLMGAFGVNALVPAAAGRVQVAATLIKLLPLVLMAAGGLALGLRSGLLAENLAYVPASGGGFPDSVVSIAFAYEGWLAATSISGELRDPRRNLPLALMAGSVLVILIYIGYYMGLAGAVSTHELMAGGHQAVRRAFCRVLGEPLGAAAFSLIVISCLGSLNGLSMANSRGLYALAVRGQAHPLFAAVDPHAGTPLSSAIAGLLLAGAWLLHFYGGELAQPPWLGPFSYDTAELPVITLYALYIPIFVRMTGKGRGEGALRRFVIPLAALASCVLMILASLAAHGAELPGYLLLSAAVMAAGWAVRPREKPPSDASPPAAK